MTPGIRAAVHNFQDRLLALEVGDVPTGGRELFAVFAGRRADHLSANAQVQAGLVSVRAAANQESDVTSLDGKRFRGQRALRSIAGQVRVNQSAARETADLLLIGMGSRRRRFTEAFAAGGPAVVVAFFEVLEHGVGALEFFRVPAQGGDIGKERRLDGARHEGAASVGQSNHRVGGRRRKPRKLRDPLAFRRGHNFVGGSANFHCKLGTGSRAFSIAMATRSRSRIVRLRLRP